MRVSTYLILCLLLQGLVEVGDIAGVVLGVMQLHDLATDHGLSEGGG